MRYALQDDLGSTISVHDDYDEAVSAAEDYAGRDGIVGHDGDLSVGGDKTLVWASESEAEDDPGANAIASIRRVED